MTDESDDVDRAPAPLAGPADGYADWAATLAGLDARGRAARPDRLRAQGLDLDPRGEPLWQPVFVRSTDPAVPTDAFFRALGEKGEAGRHAFDRSSGATTPRCAAPASPSRPSSTAASTRRRRGATARAPTRCSSSVGSSPPAASPAPAPSRCPISGAPRWPWASSTTASPSCIRAAAPPPAARASPRPGPRPSPGPDPDPAPPWAPWRGAPRSRRRWPAWRGAPSSTSPAPAPPRSTRPPRGTRCCAMRRMGR